MKRFFVITMALALLAAMPAMATETRIASLAVDRYIEDDFNVFNWPATLPSYTNLIWAHVEADDGEAIRTYLGGTYGLGEDNRYGTLGLFLYDYSEGLNPFGAGVPFEGIFSSELDNKFDILYGYAADGFALGFRFSRADMSNEYETDGTDTLEASSYTTIALGTRFDVGDNAYADLAFDINFATYELSNAMGEANEDAKMMFGVQARLFYEWMENFTWVPYFGYRSFDFSIETTPEAGDATVSGDKGFMFDFGLGANISVNEDNLLIFAIEPVSYKKWEPSEPAEGENEEWKSLTMPRFHLALESDVKDWLTFRVGAVKDLTKEEHSSEYEVDGETTSEKTTSTFGDFGYFMGLGFHVGDFDIDCLLNNDLPLHMGYWLTGNNWGGIAMYSVSALYHF